MYKENGQLVDNYSLSVRKKLEDLWRPRLKEQDLKHAERKMSMTSTYISMHKKV